MNRSLIAKRVGGSPSSASSLSSHSSSALCAIILTSVRLSSTGAAAAIAQRPRSRRAASFASG
jgi:hypothetical protein